MIDEILILCWIIFGLYIAFGWFMRGRKLRRQIDSLIQEIKQDPTISISQRNYAIKKMEELKGKL